MMIVDVYHSGQGKAPRPPFMFVQAGVVRLPAHPSGEKVSWTYWKKILLHEMAVLPAEAEAAIGRDGYHIQ